MPQSAHSALTASGGCPHIGRMTDGTRFQIRLSAERRRELAELASEAGLSSSDIARLGIRYMLQHPHLLFTPDHGGAAPPRAAA
jgi:hypothetical protein